MSETELKQPSGTVVYCGPTIPGLVKQNTIYNNGLPTALVTAIAERPTLGGLVVSLEDFPHAMKQLRNHVGKIDTLYQLAQKLNRGGT